MADILQTTVSNALVYEIFWISIKISLKFIRDSAKFWQ